MEGLHEPVLREVNAFGLRRALLLYTLHMPCAAGHKASLQTCMPGMANFLFCLCTSRKSSLPRARKKEKQEWPLLVEKRGHWREHCLRIPLPRFQPWRRRHDPYPS